MAKCLILIVALTVVWTAGPTDAATVETVPIGNPGNPADPSPDMRRNCCYGAVDYKYRMGLFEVTNDQYAEFLNAVAASDPYELYDPNSNINLRGGIYQRGTEGSYVYTVKPNYGNKPTNWVTFWDAARFANWLHNGQPRGPQDDSTTEDGAYDLGGVAYPDNDRVVRQPDARWFVPSESEWYKAAYYDPRTEAEGGPPGDDHYWFYATSSDVLPGTVRSTSEGDVMNPGPNVANFNLSVAWNGYTGHVTTVGGAGPLSRSYYGTYDQSGNVWEFNEAIIKLSGDRNFRGSRGANWDDVPRLMGASWRGASGIEDCGTRWQCRSSSNGFRVARLFSPTDLTGDDFVNDDDIDLLTQEVISNTLNTAYDLNADGLVDLQDRRVWVEDLVKTYFGDSNLDGEFGSADLVAVLTAGQYEDGILMNSSWSTGDWDGDGEFGTSDFVFVFETGAYEKGPRAALPSVPEPSTHVILQLAVALLAWHDRRRFGR